MAQSNLNTQVRPGLFQVGQALASAVTAITTVVFNLPTIAFRTAVIWQKRDEMRRHLASMDARLLEDVGLTQAQARQESEKPLWKS